MYLGETTVNIAPFLDVDGRVKQFPVKRSKRMPVLQYLAGKFEAGAHYGEKAVNEILCAWCEIDFAYSRRELVDSGYLCRTRDGRDYWVAEGIANDYVIIRRERNGNRPGEDAEDSR